MVQNIESIKASCEILGVIHISWWDIIDSTANMKGSCGVLGGAMEHQIFLKCLLIPSIPSPSVKVPTPGEVLGCSLLNLSKYKQWKFDVLVGFSHLWFVETQTFRYQNCIKWWDPTGGDYIHLYSYSLLLSLCTTQFSVK